MIFSHPSYNSVHFCSGTRFLRELMLVRWRQMGLPLPDYLPSSNQKAFPSGYRGHVASPIKPVNWKRQNLPVEGTCLLLFPRNTGS